MKINLGFLAHIANVITGATLRADSTSEPKAREWAVSRVRTLAGGRLPAEVREQIEAEVVKEWEWSRVSSYDQHDRFQPSPRTVANDRRARRAGARKGAGFGRTGPTVLSDGGN